MPKEPTDLEVIQKARPYIRSIAALVVYLSRRHDASADELSRCYRTADEFIAFLENDVQKEARP